MDFEDNMLENMLTFQLCLTAAIRKVNPNVISTHFPQDGSNDHKATAQAVMDSLISLRFPNMPIAVPFTGRNGECFFVPLTTFKAKIKQIISAPSMGQKIG